VKVYVVMSGEYLNDESVGVFGTQRAAEDAVKLLKQPNLPGQNPYWNQFDLDSMAPIHNRVKEIKSYMKEWEERNQ